MTFGERIRELRTSKKLTQPELAKELGISLRTMKNYELGESLPRTRDIYKRIATYFDVDVNYLLKDDDNFLLEAGEEYGTRGKMQANALVAEVSGLFSGGTMADEDIDEMMKAIQDAYWVAKQKNKKYTPKKYIKKDNEEK